MTTREEALEYGLSFPDTYQEAPFHDQNWQLETEKLQEEVIKDKKFHLNGGICGGVHILL